MAKPYHKHVGDLCAADFLNFPVWTWAEDLEDESSVSPVLNVNPLSDSHNALFISTRLTLSTGKFLNGSISVRCSDHKVYLVEVFFYNKSIGLPLLNSKSLSDDIQKLCDELKLPKDKIFPLVYETDYAFGNGLPVAGEINLESLNA